MRTCAEIQNIGAVDFSGRGKKAHISADFGKTLKDTAVSYTHLDVYKRQLHSKPEEDSGTLLQESRDYRLPPL